MKLSEYLKKTGMTSSEYFEMQKRKKNGTTTLADYKKQEQASIASIVDEDYIKAFYNDLAAYQSEAEKDFNGISFDSDINGLYDKHSSKASDFLERSNNIRKYLNVFKDNFDEDSFTSWNTDLDSVEEFLNATSSAFGDRKDFYTEFPTKEYYDAYLMNNTAGLSGTSTRQDAYNSVSARLAELNKQIDESGYDSYHFRAYGDEDDIPEEYKALISERDKLQAELTQYERGSKKTDELYNQYSVNTDWAEDAYKRDLKTVRGSDMASYGTIDPTTGKMYDVDESSIVMEDPLGTYLLNYNESNGNPQMVPVIYLEDENARNHAIAFNDAIEKGSGQWEYLNDDEINLYYYMLNNGLKEEALSYLDGMEVELSRRGAEGRQQKLEDASALELVFHNIVSVPANIVGGATAFVGDAIDMALGNEINPYEGGHRIQDYAQGVRTATANDINSFTGASEDAWLTWGDAYQGVMSAADSIVGAYFMGPSYTAVMGMGAAASEAKELYEKGASKEQIISGGLLAGAAEAAFESISIGYFLDEVVGAPSKSVWEWAYKALASGGIEASEEFCTTIANYITDATVRGGASDWEALIDKYKKQGHTDGSAIWQAVKEVGGEALHDGAVGAISGGFMGGGGGAVSSLSYAPKYNQAVTAQGQQIINNGGVDALKGLALEYANEMGGIKGKRLTKSANAISNVSGAKAIGQFSEKVDNARSKLNKSDIKSALVEKGLSKATAENYANVLVAMNEEYFNGNGTSFNLGTDEQWQKMTGDKNAYSVLSEIVTNAESNANLRNKKSAYAMKNIRTDDSGKIIEEDAVKYVNRKVAEAENKTISAENHFDVSSEGKAINNKTGEAVKVAEIASIKDGKMTLKLTTGETVDANDISFATEDEGIIYSAVLDMGVNAVVADSIVKGFDSAKGVSAKQYALGMQEAYRYGRYNIPMEEMSSNGFSADLSVAQRTRAYKLGQSDAKAETAAQQEAIVAKKKSGTKKAEKGKVHFDGDRNTLTDIQKTSLETLDKLSESLGVNFYIYESRVEDGKRVYTDADGNVKPAPNGMYYRDGSIHIDLNAGIDGKGTILFTASHELTHYIKQWSPAKFKVLADFLMKQYGKAGISVDTLVKQQIAKAERNGRTIDYDEAFEEVVADSMESMLTDANVDEKLDMLKQQDESLWDKIKQFFEKMSAKIREVYEGLNPNSREGQYVADMVDAIDEIQNLFTEALVDASENYSVLANAEVTTDAVAVEDTVKHSYRSLAEAAGFEAMEIDGIRGYYRNGAKVSKVTVEDIEISPIGAMINYSLDKNDITEDDAKRQKEMFAKICTMACMTNDFSMTMQFVGSAVFTGMKANADKQYGTTYDFPSICTKTQAVIDAMSAKMVNLKRGLSSEEILDLYREVFASGNPVPCPECYVFSRWIGIGGLLDNIYEYQTHYGKMSVADATKAYAELYKKVEAYANDNGISFGKAKGALAKKITDTYTKLKEKIEKAENQGENVKDADRAKLKSLENEMVTVKALTWLGDVYFAENPLDSNGNPKANPKVNKNFAVPVEVLFDLNNGEEFASKYREAWAFRTTQGAGYGKAITPYAEAVLGEGILATNNTTNTIKNKAQGKLNNPFLEQRGMLDKNSRKALDRARLKQKIQAFLGGQRFQSTSDARYENASDYLLAALEMQAMHGRVQVYTKVDGAVPAFDAWGFSINQSLMPLGGGLDAKGNVIDSKVGGMNPSVAFKNRAKHENAGTITIGVNDNHIRKMFNDLMRDFIIPYHASGGKAWLVNEFRTVQDKEVKKNTFVRSTDYSRTQGDKVLSDDVLKWMGKTDAEIKQIHAVREARLAILTGGNPNMDVVRNNRFLSALYDKFNGGEWDGVKVAKGKVESQIFPNEFWDQSLTYEQSGKVTQDYLEYCDALGILHRFSGMVPKNGILIPVNGYNELGERVQLTDLAYKYDENGNKTNEVEPYFWKVLTDRRMYDNNGNYLAQKVVSLNDTAPSTVTNFAKKNDGRQYNAMLSKETADKIAGVKHSDRDYAPTFYSQMAKVAEGIKQEKIGASSVVSYLTGKGVKAEEIKWSGIDAWLEGKKSVTKQELQEFIASSQLQISEHTRDGSKVKVKVKNLSDDSMGVYVDGELVDTFTRDADEDGDLWRTDGKPNDLEFAYFDKDAIKQEYEDTYGKKTKWQEYTLKGGKNYRELVFKMPDSQYTNTAMRVHWGDNAKGVLAHARVQDIKVDGGKMLFVEEIQSDWHNEAGKQKGKVTESDVVSEAVPDAPFKATYHEFVLKNLIRQAAENGYDSIGWTPSDIQMERWNPKRETNAEMRVDGAKNPNAIAFEEAYRNLYDRNIRKYLEKFGGKFGAEVGVTTYKGNEIWTMPITDAMKQSVLHEGQPLYSDRDYMTAVESGDMETAQKMVEEAAKNAGYTLATYHGTRNDFTVFDGDRVGNNYKGWSKYGKGFYFAKTSNDAEYWAGKANGLGAKRIIPTYLRMDNPFVVEPAKYESIDMMVGGMENLADYVQENGYDGIISGSQYVVFSPEQIKSADPITYDNNGDVIPLSKRFDSSNDDIRYSERDSSGKLTEGLSEADIENANRVISNLRNKAVGSKILDGYATYTAERMEREIKYASASGIPDYAKSYITWVDPTDFIYATTTSEQFRDRLKEEAGELDIERLKNETQPIHLTVNFETGAIVGHEGRHRLLALQKAGIDKAVVIIDALNDDRHHTKPIEMMKLKGQRFDPYSEYSRKGSDMYLHDMLPLSERYADVARKVFTAQPKSGIRYQDRDSEAVSNRSLLANALESTIDTSTQNGQNELRKLNEYKKMASTLDEWNNKLTELRAEIKQESFKKGSDRAKVAELRDEATKLANRISIYDKKLLTLEASKPLKDVLYREKAKAAKVQKQKDAEVMKAYRENAKERLSKNEAKAKLQKLVLDTSKWIANPKKEDVKCPDIIRAPYGEFLQSIDFSSKTLLETGVQTKNDLRIAKAMSKLADTVERIQNAQNPEAENAEALDCGYLDLRPEHVKTLRDMSDKIQQMILDEKYVVNEMTSEDLKGLTKLVRSINHAIREMGTLANNLRFANIEELGDHSVSFLEELGEVDSTSAVGDFFAWDNALPYYAFKRFGKAGESIFEELMDAQDKLAFLADGIMKFREKAWTSKEARTWSDDTHTIKLPSGKEITLTTADAMSIYCLSRRDNDHGLNHLVGGGVRVLGKKDGAKKAKDSRVNLDLNDVVAICNSLDSRQKAVAETIQEYMSTVCSEWGNEISMKRFLTKDFTEKRYFPIQSSDESLALRDPQAQQSDLFRLLNISATKALTPGANNTVIIRNIFDVFTEHTSDMARLNAYGMPLLDYMKWMNYKVKETNDDGQITVRGVHSAMNKAYGEAAKSYAIGLVKDINGRFNDGGDNQFLLKMSKHAKTAAVGANLRVAALQFTAYPRALMVLSPANLTKGLSKKPQVSKAMKYCGIALWKSFGFYDTNISRSIEDQIKGTTDWKQKTVELSLKGAEWADAVTWGYLWNACEYDVATSNKQVKVGTEEFNQAVAKKLREVVYSTQVVDSMITRSQIMRNKSGLTQTATAFMSEPTLTSNIVMDAGFQFYLEKRRTGSAKMAWEKTRGHITKTVAVYGATSVIISLAESLADAFRDDDEEEFVKKFGDAMLENSISNVLLFNKIPILADVMEGLLSLTGMGYFSTDRLDTTWLSDAVKAAESWIKVLGERFGDKNTSYTVYKALYDTVKAVSSSTGVAFSGLLREIVTMWNNTAGAADPDLKIKKYED